MIDVAHLGKSYGPLRAVDDVSFMVPAGETFGLLGPNGAGKTTTLHLLTGALEPDRGNIVINGQGDPTRLSVRRQIGLAPQNLALYESLTAAENLTFFCKLYGFKGARLKERVEFALALAGLMDRRGERVDTYSGGMKRRLNLACAIVHDPSVLFLDEPTVGVDPQSRNHLFETIETLARAGRTIVYTTHYMEEAQRLCKRVAIMDQGKILAMDGVPALIGKYGGKATVDVELAETPAHLDALPGRLEGKRLRYETDRPLEEIQRLTALGLKLDRFALDQPNLEKVFLNLTGRSLRD